MLVSYLKKYAIELVYFVKKLATTSEFGSGAYLHLSRDSFDLRLLQSHSLRNSQWRCCVIAVKRQRSLRNLFVAKHKVHLDGCLLGL